MSFGREYWPRETNWSRLQKPLAIAVNGAQCWSVPDLPDEGVPAGAMANAVFHTIIWLEVPTRELRALALARMKMFPPYDRHEVWACEKPEDIL